VIDIKWPKMMAVTKYVVRLSVSRLDGRSRRANVLAGRLAHARPGSHGQIGVQQIRRFTLPGLRVRK